VISNDVSCLLPAPEEAKEKMDILFDLKIRNVELSDNMYHLASGI
jgi:hypothetical protein